MDSPCIAMNEPPKFGKNQDPKRASRSSHGCEISWEPHSDREIYLVQQVPGGDGMGMAAGQPGTHTGQGLGTAQELSIPVMLIFFSVSYLMEVRQQTPDGLC